MATQRERSSGQRVTDQPKDTIKIEIGAIEKEVTSLPTSRQVARGTVRLPDRQNWAKSSLSLDLGIQYTRIRRSVWGNRNRKLLISRAPTKAKSQEPAYSQALNQNK